MKKLSFVFAMALLASMPFLTSCNKDTTPPTMNFIGGGDYISADVSVVANSAIKAGVNAQSGSSKLTRFQIVRTFNNIPTTVLDSVISTETFNITVEGFARDEAGVERWSFTITDKDGETATLAFNVTTTVGSIKSYTEKILGSYDNATLGSSFASADGTIYKLAEAKANAAKIDWMYFYGATNQATLAAPNDPDAIDVFSGSNGPDTWSVKNATKFAKVTFPAGTTWDGITNDIPIINLASGVAESKVNMLTVGQIVAFKTAAGKMGLIKIEAITGTGAGSITYSVKVQE